MLTVSKKGRNLVAHKGGQVEKEILDKFEIPSINLEDFGCPRHDKLPTSMVQDWGYHMLK